MMFRFLSGLEQVQTLQWSFFLSSAIISMQETFHFSPSQTFLALGHTVSFCLAFSEFLFPSLSLNEKKQHTQKLYFLNMLLWIFDFQDLKCWLWERTGRLRDARRHQSVYLTERVLLTNESGGTRSVSLAVSGVAHPFCPHCSNACVIHISREENASGFILHLRGKSDSCRQTPCADGARARGRRRIS